MGSEVDSNPMFGASSGFRPSLMVIEEAEREESYTLDRQSKGEGVMISTPRVIEEMRKESKEIEEKESSSEGKPQTTISPDKRLSRLSSLSKILLKRNSQREMVDREEKIDDEDSQADQKPLLKKKSIRNIFKNN